MSKSVMLPGIRIEPEVDLELRQFAIANDITVAETMRRAVRLYLGMDPINSTPDPRLIDIINTVLDERLGTHDQAHQAAS